MTFRSALYVGSVMHRRLRPHVHRLRYRVFWMLVDLDEMATLARRLRLFSYNRFNLVSFHDTDHGEGGPEPLRAQVERHLGAANIDIDSGAIRLLCMPRIFGYGFNPISVYFCHRRNGTLAALLHEVHNTFGERHSYLIPVDTPPGTPIRQRCDKRFYVSPFMDMAMTYDFLVAAPGERVAVTIRGSDAQGPLIVAALEGQRVTLADGRLARLLVSHALLTLKVMGAIHWHALRLWLGGLRLRRRPHKPEHPVTIINTNG